MAISITSRPPAPDPRDLLQKKLEQAPREHAEALLSAYEVLQGLHDRGLLEMLRGLLGSSDDVLQILVEAVNTPQVIRGIRNLMVLAKIADNFEPEFLEKIASSISETIKQSKEEQPEEKQSRETRPPSWFSLISQMTTKDSRRALSLFVGILESTGKGLKSESSIKR